MRAHPAIAQDCRTETGKSGVARGLAPAGAGKGRKVKSTSSAAPAGSATISSKGEQKMDQAQNRGSDWRKLNDGDE